MGIPQRHIGPKRVHVKQLIKRVAIIMAMLTATAGLMLVITCVLQFTLIYEPVPFRQSKFDLVANWVLNHKSGTTSVVRLPQQYQIYSKTGHAYVTGDYVFVPIWLGRNTILPSPFTDDKECYGYLYVKHSLIMDKLAGDEPQVTVNVPVFSGLYGVNQVTGVAALPMIVTPTEDSHWYYLTSLSNLILVD